MSPIPNTQALQNAMERLGKFSILEVVDYAALSHPTWLNQDQNNALLLACHAFRRRAQEAGQLDYIGRGRYRWIAAIVQDKAKKPEAKS